jgi:hypothetical protein
MLCYAAGQVKEPTVTGTYREGTYREGTYREGTYREVSMLLSRSVKAITTTNRAIGSVGYAARVLPMFQH